jgi:hypothetical protein
MSIAERAKIAELERRVETSESMVKQLYTDAHTPKPATLTLPEKRKSA